MKKIEGGVIDEEVFSRRKTDLQRGLNRITREEKRREITKPVVERERIEKDLIIEEENEKAAKEFLSQAETKLDRATTAPERVQAKREVEGQKQNLKTITEKVKKLKDDYKKIWEKEENEIKTTIKKKGEDLVTRAREDFKGLEETWKAAKELEKQKTLEVAMLTGVEPTKEGLETLERAKEELTRLRKERGEIEGRYKPVEEHFTRESGRLTKINEAEISLRTERKEVLLKGNLDKKAKIESTLEALQEERGLVEYELKLPIRREVERQKEAIQSSKEKIDELEKYIPIKELEQQITTPPEARMKQAQVKWEGLPKQEQKKTSPIEMARQDIEGEIDRMRKRYPYVLERLAPIKQLLEDLPDIITRTKEHKNKLDLEKIKAIAEMDKKLETLKDEAGKWQETFLASVGKLDNLPKEINGLIEDLKRGS